MKISTKGRYGLRVMVDLAKHDNGLPIALKDIANRENISVKYLEQIMRLLSSSGFIQSQRGSSGGYRLTRNSNQYTIKEILEVCEGNFVFLDILEDEENNERCCESALFWKEFYEHIVSYLQSYTLADVVSKGMQIEYII